MLARTKISKLNRKYCNNFLFHRKNTHTTDKTVNLINWLQYIVTQKQYMGSADVLSRTKIYKRNRNY